MKAASANRAFVSVPWSTCALSLALNVFSCTGPGTDEEQFVRPQFLVEVIDADIDVLTGVVIVAPDVGFAVGSGGSALSFDGVAWTLEETPGTVFMHDVAAALVAESGDSIALAVGAGGAIWLRSDDEWSIVESPVEDDLFGVWLVSSTDGFIVGDNGKILRFDGTYVVEMVEEATQQREVPDPNGGGGTVLEPYAIPEPLKDVAAESSTSAYAVGPNGTVYRFDGSFWRRETTNTARPLSSVTFAGGSVWATTTDGIVLRRRGANDWDNDSYHAPVPLALKGAWARSAGDLFTVGTSGTVYRLTNGVWDDTSVDVDLHFRSIDGLVLAEETEEDPPVLMTVMVGGGPRIVMGPYAVKDAETGVISFFGDDTLQPVE